MRIVPKAALLASCWVVVLVGCVATTPTAWRPNGSRALTRQERVLGLAIIYAGAKQHFAWFERVPDLDWEAAFTRFVPLVEKEQTLFEYHGALAQFTALLRDGHTDILLPTSIHQRRDRLPITIDFVDGEYVVVERLPTREMLNKDLPVGTGVLEIEGMRAADYLARHVYPLICASNERARRWLVNKHMTFPANAEVKLKLRYPDGSEAVRVVRASRKGIKRTHALKERYLLPWHREPPFSWQLLEGDILYIRYGRCDERCLRGFLRLMDSRPAKTRAMIIDLRGNSGGNTPAEAIRRLIREEIPSTVWMTRCSISLVDASLQNARRQGMSERRIAKSIQDAVSSGKLPRAYSPPGWYKVQDSLTPHPDSYTGPLFLLTNVETASAAEGFVAILRGDGRAKVIGEPTMGATGQPIMFDLPGGGKVRVCTSKLLYPDGSAPSSTGIRPDIALERTAKGISEGRDEILENALNRVRVALARSRK